MDPHVLAVQEVGDPAALQELADRVGGTWLTADDYRTEMADRFAHLERHHQGGAGNAGRCRVGWCEFSARLLKRFRTPDGAQNLDCRARPTASPPDAPPDSFGACRKPPEPRTSTPTPLPGLRLEAVALREHKTVVCRVAPTAAPRIPCVNLPMASPFGLSPRRGICVYHRRCGAIHFRQTRAPFGPHSDEDLRWWTRCPSSLPLCFRHRQQFVDRDSSSG